MTIYIEPKKDCSIQDADFYTGTEYRAIIVDFWEEEDKDKNIVGMMITGGHLSHKIVSTTQGDLFDRFYVRKKE